MRVPKALSLGLCMIALRCVFWNTAVSCTCVLLGVGGVKGGLC